MELGGAGIGSGRKGVVTYPSRRSRPRQGPASHLPGCRSLRLIFTGLRKKSWLRTCTASASSINGTVLTVRRGALRGGMPRPHPVLTRRATSHLSQSAP